MGKIDLSKITDVFKKLAFLRSLSTLLLPLGIVFAAVVVFAAALLMGRSFREKVAKQSVPVGKEVESQLRNPISMGQVEEERRYQQEYQKDANSIEKMAIESTQRELLSYGIFPEPNETSTLLFTRFGSRFCEVIEGKISRLNARDCPSEEEIKTSVAKTAGAARSSGAADVERITEEFCQSRARNATVYASPASISGYIFWQQFQYTKIEDAVKDCWFWQLGSWIIEDVLDTVGKMNSASSNVFGSPVKRIVYTGFTPSGKGKAAGSGQVPQDRPKYITKPGDMLAESYTGRTSNADIDVVQFSVVVVVSPEGALPFMKELCSAKEHRFYGYKGQGPEQVFKHNQISVLQSRIRPVVVTDTRHRRYRYGPEPIMELELVCEYVFNKKGYEGINPEAMIKETKGKEPEEQ
jgi:hypothetical protein